jgi:hypothetical protein
MVNVGKIVKVNVDVYALMDIAGQIVKPKESLGIVLIVWALTRNGRPEKIKIICVYALLVIGQAVLTLNTDMFNVLNVLVIMDLWRETPHVHINGDNNKYYPTYVLIIIIQISKSGAQNLHGPRKIHPLDKQVALFL